VLYGSSGNDAFYTGSKVIAALQSPIGSRGNTLHCRANHSRAKRKIAD
jgi:hypothetical protein